jgi:hypothetical protein
VWAQQFNKMMQQRLTCTGYITWAHASGAFAFVQLHGLKDCTDLAIVHTGTIAK